MSDAENYFFLKIGEEIGPAGKDEERKHQMAVGGLQKRFSCQMQYTKKVSTVSTHTFVRPVYL